MGGYGNYTKEVTDTVEKLICLEGIPTDTTYVGKAFCGMCRYIEENRITDKNILFIHTGGTPLFFDYMDKKEKEDGV